MKSNSPQSASKSFDSTLLSHWPSPDYSLTGAVKKPMVTVALPVSFFDLPSTTTEIGFHFLHQT
jgi:hypothetical protein